MNQMNHVLYTNHMNHVQDMNHNVYVTGLEG